MKQHTKNRILSLEKSIQCLREVNQSDTLRNNIKYKNKQLIEMYVSEICDDLAKEIDGIPYNFMKHHMGIVII